MVTKDEVLKHMRPLNKIGLINEYRDKTGLGLREAKDAVEAALSVSNMSEMQIERHGRERYKFECNSSNYTPEQLLQREQQMLITFGLIDPVSKTEITPSTRMKNALNFAIDNWEVMGFESPRNAAHTILSNF